MPELLLRRAMEASRWVRVAQVDAFATQGTAGGGAFSGNPAAVCLLPPLLDGESRSSAANNVRRCVHGDCASPLICHALSLTASLATPPLRACRYQWTSVAR